MRITLVARNPVGDVDELEISDDRWRQFVNLLDELECDTTSIGPDHSDKYARARDTNAWAVALQNGLAHDSIASVQHRDRLVPGGVRTDLVVSDSADVVSELTEAQRAWLHSVVTFLKGCGGFDWY